jgi:hypothetical protein
MVWALIALLSLAFGLLLFRVFSSWRPEASYAPQPFVQPPRARRNLKAAAVRLYSAAPRGSHWEVIGKKLYQADRVDGLQAAELRKELRELPRAETSELASLIDNIDKALTQVIEGMEDITSTSEVTLR